MEGIKGGAVAPWRRASPAGCAGRWRRQARERASSASSAEQGAILVVPGDRTAAFSSWRRGTG